MLDWLLKLLGMKKPETVQSPVAKASPPPPLPESEPRKADVEAEEEAEKLKRLPEEDALYLTSLLSGGVHTNLQNFPPHDRAFIALLMRKANAGELEIPLLPEAAVSIRKLMRNPDVNIGQFVEVFKSDPSLSAEVLKVANSSFYGFETRTHELGQAVLRIGYNQVRSIVMIVSLRSKVLHAGHYGLESELIANLALATARAAGILSSELGLGEDEAFTRGLLAHLDFFVILGVAAEFNAGHKGVTVSREALAEAVGRVGRQVMELVGKKWGLENLGYSKKEGEENQSEITAMRDRMTAIGQAVLEAWSGGQVLTQVQSIPSDRLAEAALKAVGRGKPQ